jgi:hypothetical protein
MRYRQAGRIRNPWEKVLEPAQASIMERTVDQKRLARTRQDTTKVSAT